MNWLACGVHLPDPLQCQVSLREQRWEELVSK